MGDKTLSIARGQCTVIVENAMQPVERRFFQQIQEDATVLPRENRSHRVPDHEHLFGPVLDFGQPLEIGQEGAGFILERQELHSSPLRPG